jgi:transcriptional regulator
MYNIPYFKTAENADITAFMKAFPFITLCGTDAEGKPVATHVPVLIEEREGTLFLQAHVMRGQEHTTAFEKNPSILAIFHGAHSYVSASWYETKNVASTWNYQAVHAKGILRFLDDAGLYQLLIKLTDHFENNPHSPALVTDMNEGYVRSMMKAITAFEIEVTQLEHVFKLSQNRDAKSFDNIIHQLRAGDTESQAVATEMEKQKNLLFPQ